MSSYVTEGAVFVQTNEPTNGVIAFRRGPDGELSRPTKYDTGGAGDGEPYLTSQGSVVLTSDGRHLLVTNVASDDVSLFAVTTAGDLELIGVSPTGPAPKSLAEHAGLVFALASGGPALTGFRLDQRGLQAVAGGEQALSPDADPAQVGFTPDGSAIIVTERGTDSISAIPVHADGSLGRTRTIASSGRTPYGFALSRAGFLVVTEAFGAEKGAGAASSYWVTGADVMPVTKSVGNGRSEICWAVITEDGRFAFTTNFADGAVSRYSIAGDGTLALDEATAAFSVDGRPGLRDAGLTTGGRYLYAIDAGSGSLFGWGVAADGVLSSIGSWGGLPITVAGLAAR